MVDAAERYFISKRTIRNVREESLPIFADADSKYMCSSRELSRICEVFFNDACLNTVFKIV